MSNIRRYWSEEYGFEKIKNTMSINRFEKIREMLHFNDNTKMLPKDHADHDRLHKLRPVIDFLNKTFQTVPFEKCLSVDEQMCATKARHYMKQYMPLKPHKWGYKLYVLSGVTGYAYQFEIYSGQENSEKYRFPNEPDLGASANNVIRLCRSIPKNCNYIVYFDNYYTGIPLMSYLFSNGILSLGTVRRNRLPNCKFSSDTDLKKKTRGSFEEYVTFSKYPFCLSFMAG